MPELLADAGMVIVSVPIHLTEQVIKQLPPLPEDCILAISRQLKQGPLQAMLAVHNRPCSGLHPMFRSRMSQFYQAGGGLLQTDVSRAVSVVHRSKLQVWGAHFTGY